MSARSRRAGGQESEEGFRADRGIGKGEYFHEGRLGELEKPVMWCRRRALHGGARLVRARLLNPTRRAASGHLPAPATPATGVSTLFLSLPRIGRAAYWARVMLQLTPYRPTLITFRPSRARSHRVKKDAVSVDRTRDLQIFCLTLSQLSYPLLLENFILFLF
jgi:hypothetical protein